MSDRDQINRRDFIVTTAGVAGSASALAGATLMLDYLCLRAKDLPVKVTS